MMADDSELKNLLQPKIKDVSFRNQVTVNAIWCVAESNAEWIPAPNM